MKLHDLRPAEGSRKERIRVGRGIAAGKGKTAGRGTKGQKARAGGGIPAWFEGGQTPLHMRIPKLRGFKNRFKVEYEVVNIGAIDALVAKGAFETEAPTGKGGAKAVKLAQITINQDILRAVGLVRTLNKPLKILGAGELSAPLFVVADAFTGTARAKIEAAGGSVNVLEMPTTPLRPIGIEPATPAEPAESVESVESVVETAPEPAVAAPAPKKTRAPKAAPVAEVEAPAAELAEDDGETAPEDDATVTEDTAGDA
jgi:large subunit ribosomal protein L15